MKKALVLALMLGSSSFAMADSSYSFQARARVSFATASAPVVRDHRTTTPYLPVPAPKRFENVRMADERFTRAPAAPVITADCANWDPMLDAASACDGYRTQARGEMPTSYGRWTVLASRESAVPDHQYVAVEKAFRKIRIDAFEGARPAFEKVGVRYMDGTTQIVQLGSRTCGANGITIDVDQSKAISAVVVYTVDGSRGAYSISAS